MVDITEVNPIYKLSSLMTNLSISNDLMDRIKVTQAEDKELQKLFTSFELVKKGFDGVIRFNGRFCKPFNQELKNEVLQESHHSKCTILPGLTKMF